MRKSSVFSMRSVLAPVMALFIFGLCFSTAYDALAGEMFIYPKNGQSNEQMEKDKYECYSWAKKQSGFDPMEKPTATAPPPKQDRKKGGLLKGAAGGALLGAGIGAIAGNTGKGAAIGAGSGAVIGGVRQKNKNQKQEQEKEQWAREQTDQYANKRNSYNRAYAACLEGKGYTVK